MKRALITGASSGFGEAFTLELVKQGVECVVFARRLHLLEDLKQRCDAIQKDKVVIMQLDARDNNALDVLEQAICEHQWSFDLVINNAGFGYIGEFATMDETLMHDMIEVNITFLTRLTRRMIPYMNKKGVFLHVSSLAGAMSGPYMNVYYATKNYVSAFSLACDIEFKPLGLRSLAFIPGPVHTGFGQVARSGSHPMRHIKSQDIDSAIQQAFKGLKRQKRFIVSQPSHHVLLFLVKWLPQYWVASVVSYLQKKRTQ